MLISLQEQYAHIVMTKREQKDSIMVARIDRATLGVQTRGTRRRAMPLLTGLVLITLASAGCTNQAFYESTEAWRISQCDRYAPRDRDECLATAKMPYSEYKTNRNEPVPSPTPEPDPPR